MKYKEFRKITKEEAKNVILQYLERDGFIEEIATEIVPNEQGQLDKIELIHTPEYCKEFVKIEKDGNNFGSVYTDDLVEKVAKETIKQNIDTVSEWVTSKYGVLRISTSFKENIGFYYIAENGALKRYEANTAKATLLRDCEDSAGYGFVIMSLTATP